MVEVKSKVVKGVSFYDWRKPYLRWDTFPFACAYFGGITISLSYFEEYNSTAIVLGVLVLLHILLLLFSHWSISVRCFVSCARAKDLNVATVCKVTPTAFSGSAELCPLERTSANEVDPATFYFDFRRERFTFDPTTNTFAKLSSRKKEAFGRYLGYNGLQSETLKAAAEAKWGPNKFEIPVPSFQQLYKEQMLEPFFVFQVFCVILWCLDEYWYYSLFTLAMLMLFESTVAKSRQRTLEELRTFTTPMQSVLVLRFGRWERLSGEDLLPGDIVSIGRPALGLASSNQFAVPADMLLLAGSCIVNEAVLTGESTPQWKTAVSSRNSTDVFDAKKDKMHLLFGGTKILQQSQDKTARIKTPDGGCVAIVQRTGFNTSQGKLMRTIMFSTERVTANSVESALFLCVLVVFAVGASGYVLKMGLADATRSRYKLLLNCVMIITSVIPPELPMELSLAVSTSLLALSRVGIYCTEPFRIPVAGK
ncbi:hypothetical protein CYMTET_9259, partial [Cymbomonas tetramitiformis]